MSEEQEITDQAHRYRLPLKHIIDTSPQGKPMVFSYHHVYLQALKGAGTKGLTVGQMRAHLRLIDKIETAVARLRTPSGDAVDDFDQMVVAVSQALGEVIANPPENRADRVRIAGELAGALAAFNHSLLVDLENGYVEILPSEWAILEGPVRSFPYNGLYKGAIQLDDDLNAIDVIGIRDIEAPE